MNASASPVAAALAGLPLLFGGFGWLVSGISPGRAAEAGDCIRPGL
jgi:hypothetical protein